MSQKFITDFYDEHLLKQPNIGTRYAIGRECERRQNMSGRFLLGILLESEGSDSSGKHNAKSREIPSVLYEASMLPMTPKSMIIQPLGPRTHLAFLDAGCLTVLRGHFEFAQKLNALQQNVYDFFASPFKGIRN